MLKRSAAFLLAAVMVWLLGAAALADTMQQGSMYVSTANGRALRFRSSKSTTADNILAEIPYGTKVYVLNWDGTWARIRYNSAVGYVVKKHLTIARPEPFETVQALRAQAEAQKAKEREIRAANRKLDHSRLKKTDSYDVTVRTGVDGLTAFVYKKADLTSAILRSYDEGVRLSVTAKNRDWAMVYDGARDEEVGYMLLEDLEEDIMEEEILEED